MESRALRAIEKHTGAAMLFVALFGVFTPSVLSASKGGVLNRVLRLTSCFSLACPLAFQETLRKCPMPWENGQKGTGYRSCRSRSYHSYIQLFSYVMRVNLVS